MNESAIIHFARIALGTGFTVCVPCLVVITVVGLGTSIVQAIVQVQEQSVGFVLKLMATMLTLAVVGPWMTRKLCDLIVGTLTNLSGFIQ